MNIDIYAHDPTPLERWYIMTSGLVEDRKKKGGILLPIPARNTWDYWQGIPFATRRLAALKHFEYERVQRETGIEVFERVPMQELAR